MEVKVSLSPGLDAAVAGAVQLLLPLLTRAEAEILERLDSYGKGVAISNVVYWVVRRIEEDPTFPDGDSRKAAAVASINIARPGLTLKTINALIEQALTRMQVEALTGALPFEEAPTTK